MVGFTGTEIVEINRCRRTTTGDIRRIASLMLWTSEPGRAMKLAIQVGYDTYLKGKSLLLSLGPTCLLFVSFVASFGS